MWETEVNKKRFTDLITLSAQNGIIAGTTRTRVGATPLIAQLNRVATSTAPSSGTILGDGVLLPPSMPGIPVLLYNSTANPIQVYAQGADTINGVAGSTGVPIPAYDIALFMCAGVGSWGFEAGVGSSGSLNTVLSCDNITAYASGGQASATLLPGDINRITTAAAGSSIKLPASAPGLDIYVINHGANAVQVFGSGTDTINDIATATGVSQMVGSMTLYSCSTAGAWYSNGIGEGYVGSLMTQNYQTGVSAAGTTQATGTQLTNQIAIVTTVGANAGVNLPGTVVVTTSQSAGLECAVVNLGANPLFVYPPQGATSDTINGQASTAGVIVNPGTTAFFTSGSNGVWTGSGASTQMAVSNTIASAASLTLTTAVLTGGVASVDCTITGSTAVTTLVTDSAVNIVKAVHCPVVGTSYRLRIINVYTNATSALTGGSGVTVNSAGSGGVTIPLSGWREFVVKVTNVAAPAVTITSVATGTWT